MFWKFRNTGSCRKDNGWIRLHGGLLWCYWMLETQGPNHGLGKPHQSMAGPRAERSSPGESLKLEVSYLTPLIREMCLIGQSHSWIDFSVVLWFILPFGVADHTVSFFASSACFFQALSVSVVLKLPIFSSNLLLEGAVQRPLSDNLSAG